MGFTLYRKQFDKYENKLSFNEGIKDIKKRNKLLKFITLSDIQSIITTTDLKNINKKIIDNSAVFYVKNGIVERK